MNFKFVLINVGHIRVFKIIQVDTQEGYVFIRIQIMQRILHDCAYLENVIGINFVMEKIPPVLIMSTHLEFIIN